MIQNSFVYFSTPQGSAILSFLVLVVAHSAASNHPKKKHKQSRSMRRQSCLIRDVTKPSLLLVLNS